MAGTDDLEILYFLGRGGEIFGPYSEREFRLLEKRGELKNFSWICTSRDTTWKSIDPSPAAVKLEKYEGSNADDTEVICHDNQNLISGLLRLITPTGCELVSPQRGLPSFGAKGRVHLNLFDAKTGKSTDVLARISKVMREGSAWIYQLRWYQGCPRF